MSRGSTPTGIACALLVCATLSACGAERVPVRVHDAADILSSAERATLDKQLDLLARETRVEIRIVTTQEGAGSL